MPSVFRCALVLAAAGALTLAPAGCSRRQSGDSGNGRSSSQVSPGAGESTYRRDPGPAAKLDRLYDRVPGKDREAKILEYAKVAREAFDAMKSSTGDAKEEARQRAATYKAKAQNLYDEFMFAVLDVGGEELWDRRFSRLQSRFSRLMQPLARGLRFRD